MAKSKWGDVKSKLILVEGWARDGLTDEQIAKNLGISKDTFYRYKKEHPDFSDSIKKGKEIVDYEVENALLKTALGFEHTYKDQKVTKDGDVIDYEHTEYIAPSNTAQIFWLKNRKPKQWRERIDVDNYEPIEDLSGLAEMLLKGLEQNDSNAEN